MFHIPTACFTCRPSCCSYILWNVDQSDSFDGLFRLSHFQCERTSHRNPDEKLQHEKWSLFVPTRTHCGFPSFFPAPSQFILIHFLPPSHISSLPHPPLYFHSPLPHYSPLSFCSLIAVMYRLPGLFSTSLSPNRIVQQGLCRSLWGERQCRGPAVPQVENPHWKLDVKVSLLAMRLSQRKPLFVQSML